MKYTVNKANTFQQKGEFLKVGAPVDMPEGDPVTSIYLKKGYITAPKPKGDSKSK
ncbi:hypothetical protein KUV46_15705 [Thalassovita mediterranea]|nr:hypothetical protein KUV46_15705 [Thalassovita mediterranea]